MSIYNVTVGEVVDLLKSDEPAPDKKTETARFLANQAFFCCLDAVRTYSATLEVYNLPRLFDLPHENLIPEDILNILSETLEQNPEFRSESLSHIMIAALKQHYNPDLPLGDKDETR